MDPRNTNDAEGPSPDRDLTGSSIDDEEKIQARIHGKIGFEYLPYIKMWGCDTCDTMIKFRNKTKHLHSQSHIDHSRDYNKRHWGSDSDTYIF